MSALSDLADTANQAVASIDAAIAAIGALGHSDAAALGAITTQLSDAKTRLDAALAAAATPASS